MIKHEHKTFKDDRGSYTPINTKVLDTDWTQCSISINTEPFTFRGLHYQTNPPQTKYVKVVQGSIIDFMVDLEISMSTLAISLLVFSIPEPIL